MRPLPAPAAVAGAYAWVGWSVFLLLAVVLAPVVLLLMTRDARPGTAPPAPEAAGRLPASSARPFTLGGMIAVAVSGRPGGRQVPPPPRGPPRHGGTPPVTAPDGRHAGRPMCLGQMPVCGCVGGSFRHKILIMRTSTVTRPFLRPMRRGGARHAIPAALACGVLLAATTACGDTADRTYPGGAPGINNPASSGSPRPAVRTRPPGLGDRMWKQVPADTRQLVVVYGDSRDSPDSLVVLYEKRGTAWDATGSWHGHNGRMGWTTEHRMDDERSPVGVFTLTDAGGALADPGSRLEYWHDDNAFAPTISDDEAHAHDFDYVIAINYNRLKGAPPYDWNRPEGVEKGGGIWLHLDHGDGTSACVTVPESGMKTLLRTLDPARHPVVVMGDRDRLKS